MLHIEPITDNDSYWLKKFSQAMELWDGSEALQESCDTYFDLVKKLPSFRESNEQTKIEELYNEWLLAVF